MLIIDYYINKIKMKPTEDTSLYIDYYINKIKMKPTEDTSLYMIETY